MLTPDGGADSGASSVHQAAAHGISGGGGKLPDADKIQKSFGGYDISNIQAHLGGAANEANQAMGADAYASGNHVVLGEGGKDLHTQAHEATHVIQQQAGVSLSGGVGQAGDRYEKHADEVADAVVEGKPAEDLLGQIAGGGGEAASVQMQEVDSAGATSADAECVGVGSETQATAVKPESSSTTTTTPVPSAAENSAITTGETTSFAVNLTIPLVGPLKLDIGAAGSYSRKKNGAKVTVEVEGMLAGGVLIDLVLFKIRAGLEGRIKFVVEDDEDLMGAIKRGMREVSEYRIAKDLIPRVRAVQANLGKIAPVSTTRRFQSSLQDMRRAIREDRDLDATKKWKLSTSPREWVYRAIEDWNGTLVSQISALGADVEILNAELGLLEPVARALEAVERAKSPNEALKLIDLAEAVGLDALTGSADRAGAALGELKLAPNDPKVGFTASLAFKAGVSSQLGTQATGEISLSAVSSIGDKVGETTWDHRSEASQIVSARLAMPPWTTSLTGTFRPKTIEIAASFLNEKSTLKATEAKHTIKALAPAFKALKNAGGISAMPIHYAKGVVMTMGDVLASQKSAF